METLMISVGAFQQENTSLNWYCASSSEHWELEWVRIEHFESEGATEHKQKHGENNFWAGISLIDPRKPGWGSVSQIAPGNKTLPGIVNPSSHANIFTGGLQNFWCSLTFITLPHSAPFENEQEGLTMSSPIWAWMRKSENIALTHTVHSDAVWSIVRQNKKDILRTKNLERHFEKVFWELVSICLHASSDLFGLHCLLQDCSLCVE